MKLATTESPRMFDRDLFDMFSRTHPMVVPALYIPGAGLPLVYAVARHNVNALAVIGLFGAGFVAWTLTEYWLHRLVFHYPARGPLGERIHFYIHGVHHLWFKDKYRLVMPPAVSLSLYFLFALLFRALLGQRLAWPFHSGFVAGYFVYDMTHYATHHLRPRTRWGQFVRKHHFLHHFKDDSQRFGVSSPIWDWVFGTMQSTAPAASRGSTG
jgi:dihydroceramide fatty acyl 2-hydroxylase